MKLIASGGIRDGVDVAKAIRLGADIAGQAAGVPRAATVSTEAVVAHFEIVIRQLAVACFCTGSADLAALRQARLLPSAALRGGIRSEKISLCFQIVVICAAAALTNIGTKIFLRIVSVPNIYPSCAQSNGGLSLRTTNSPSARAAAGLAGVTRASATL